MLQDLMQKPGEAIFPYFAWNIKTFKRFTASKPDDMQKASQADAAFKEEYGNSLINTGQFFQIQVFIAKLH